MKNNKKVMSIILVLLGIAGAASLFANGGYFGEGNIGNGNLVLLNSNDLQITDEKLDISLHKGYAIVNVHYKIKNSGDKTEARFGFPCLIFNEKEIKRQEIEQYRIKDNNTPVKFVFIKDKNRIQWMEAPGSFLGYDNTDTDLHPFIAWYVSNLDFKKNESKSVDISYISNYENEVMYISNDTRGGKSTFKYLISFGSTWKGPIAKGKVTINTDGLGEISADIEPSGRFEKKDNNYVWEFKDLEPTGQDNITIHLGGNYEFYPGYTPDEEGKNIFVLDKTYYRDISFIASGSSYLREKNFTHLYNHLNDNTFDTAWVEGKKGDGIDEYIELTPRKPSKITHVLLASGFLKSKDLYEQNNRPSEVEVILNDKYTKTFALSDEFTTYYAGNPYAYHFLDVRGLTDEDITNIKVVIKKVFKGSKYDDTAISEVKLVEKLESKPQIRMAR